MVAPVQDWSLDPDDNGNQDGIPMFEGMQPAQLNNGVRAIMSAVRQFYDGITTALQNAVDSMVNAGLTAQTGDFKHSFAVTCAGWVAAHGGTIGNAASGATARANSDTVLLFTLLWTTYPNSFLAIQDSAGVPSVRGASAAADYAANKRLPVFDARDRVIRSASNGSGYAPSSTLGAPQEDAFQGHLHSIAGAPQAGFGNGYTGSNGVTGFVINTTGGEVTNGANGTPRISSETRMRNIAANPFLKL